MNSDVTITGRRGDSVFYTIADAMALCNQCNKEVWVQFGPINILIRPNRLDRILNGKGGTVSLDFVATKDMRFGIRPPDDGCQG